MSQDKAKETAQVTALVRLPPSTGSALSRVTQAGSGITARPRLVITVPKFNRGTASSLESLTTTSVTIDDTLPSKYKLRSKAPDRKPATKKVRTKQDKTPQQRICCIKVEFRNQRDAYFIREPQLATQGKITSKNLIGYIRSSLDELAQRLGITDEFYIEKPNNSGGMVFSFPLLTFITNENGPNVQHAAQINVQPNLDGSEPKISYTFYSAMSGHPESIDRYTKFESSHTINGSQKANVQEMVDFLKQLILTNAIPSRSWKNNGYYGCPLMATSNYRINTQLNVA